MDDKAINQTASRVGLSPVTVATVVGTYLDANPNGVSTNICPVCDKGYKSAKGLVTHIKKAH